MQKWSKRPIVINSLMKWKCFDIEKIFFSEVKPQQFWKKGPSLLKTKLWQFWHYFIKIVVPEENFVNSTVIFWSPLSSDQFFPACLTLYSDGQFFFSDMIFSLLVLTVGLAVAQDTYSCPDGWLKEVRNVFMEEKSSIVLNVLTFQYFRRTDLGAVASCLVLTRWLPDQLQILSAPDTLDHGLLSLTTLVSRSWSSLFNKLDHPGKTCSLRSKILNSLVGVVFSF